MTTTAFDMRKDTGGPAFPKAVLDPWNKAVEKNTGMTLRDYFAAKASEEDIKNHTTTSTSVIQEVVDLSGGHKRIVKKEVENKTPRELAKYLYADAMLEARK